MKNSKNINIARRYATSLIELNKQEKVSYDEFQNSLNNVKEILNNSKDLCDVLNNPIISAHDKEEIVETVFNQDADTVTRNFIKLLINKNRFNSIFDIIDLYNENLDNIKNIENISVTSAVELDEEKRNKIQNKLKEKLHKEIKVNYSLDNNIIAGLVYKIKDDVIDTSLAHKIEKFTKEIIK